ncbi:MAG: hypothetical protein H7Y62_06580 [Hyphomicrobium sp.]|nr:hypothetical protein [Hyphomicrobium sp.]
MERRKGLPSSRKPGVESATAWIVGMLGLGIIAALLVAVVAPPAADETTGPATSTEQVVPTPTQPQ